MSLTPEQLELYHTQAENPARYGGEVVVRADDMLELLDAYQRQSTYQPTRPLTAVAIALDEIERREAAEKRVAELERMLAAVDDLAGDGAMNLATDRFWNRRQ